MCGLAGILEFDPGAQPSMEGLRRMADVLAHRGPDEAGFYQDGPVGLAHRRLSIIDLATGKQPMESPDGKVCLVFNGEIYNYPELKEELEQKGYEFCTKSDTEVLLASYLAYGTDAFPRINGMFACAFWDARSRQLILARDRFGKKPLYYYRNAHRFLFGSEVKALLAYGTIERKVAAGALHEYLTHGYIVGEQSIVEGIHRLPPAHVLVAGDRQTTSRPYWAFEMRPGSQQPEEADAVNTLEELLRAAVKRRLMSDVPLGAFLSGGLDSSTVVAFMAQLSNRPVKTFTIGFDESDYSELADARIVAKHLGTDHQEIMVKPSALDVLPDLVWHLDEPFGDSSAVPTYYVCQAARRHVTVALSGDGGDEVFAGYRRYQELASHQRIERVPTWIRRGVIKPLVGVLPFTWPGWNYLHAVGHWKNGGLPCNLGLFPYIQDSLYSPDFKRQTQSLNAFESTERYVSQAQGLDPISRYQYLDTLQYLPSDILTKVDRMSMANSLEVRSPLLDYVLVDYVTQLPLSLKLRQATSKYILRKVCQRLLPPSALSKPKQGFAIPKDRWFQNDVRGFAREILLDPRTIGRGYFQKDALATVLTHHTTARRDYSDWIWSLIVLEMWFRVFLDESG